MLLKIVSSGAAIFAAIFVFAGKAEANVPLVPIAMTVAFQVFAFFWTLSVGAVMITVIEAYMLVKCEKISWKEALKLSFLANLFSTLIGLGIIFISSSGMLLLPGIALYSGAFAYMTKKFDDATGILPKSLKTGMPWLFAAFLVCGAFLSFLSVFAVPGHSFVKPTEFAGPGDIMLAVAVAAAMVFAGFVMSIISEGYLITRIISVKRQESALTIQKANVASYAALIFISSIKIYGVIAAKEWFWHR